MNKGIRGYLFCKIKKRYDIIFQIHNIKRIEMFKRVIGMVLVFGVTMAFGMSIKEVNKASKEELTQIKGIGDAKADAIIKARKSSKFKSFDDLEKVKGVGPALVKNIKDDVKVKEEKKESKKKNTKKEKK